MPQLFQKAYVSWKLCQTGKNVIKEIGPLNLHKRHRHVHHTILVIHILKQNLDESYWCLQNRCSAEYDGNKKQNSRRVTSHFVYSFLNKRVSNLFRDCLINLSVHEMAPGCRRNRIKCKKCKQIWIRRNGHKSRRRVVEAVFICLCGP